MSNYKHFSEIYILVRVIALLFLCTLSFWRTAAHVQNQVCEVERRITKQKLMQVCSKMEIFHGFLTFTDGEYTCEM